LGEVLNASDITSLPLNGRVFSQLVQTVPGSVAAGFGSAPEAAAGAGSSGSITASVNGMPWGGTTYTLDGVNNMELLNAFINVTPPLDAIQELRISTNNADITVGTYGGAQVNAFMKSGTNAFHGSAYEFFRDDALSAYKWRAVSKAPFRANQFGGSIGGPIIRNKAFFFVSLERASTRNGQSTSLTTVPIDEFRVGDMRKLVDTAGRRIPLYDPFDAAGHIITDPFARPILQCNGVVNVICPSRIDAIAQAALDVRSDIIVLCHGGPIAEPADAALVLNKTRHCHGFYGASSMERLPTEKAITKQAQDFKRISF